VLIHKAIVGAATGGLVTLAALVLLLHPTGSERLVVACLLQVIVTVVVVGLIERPGVRRPTTWAGAMAGAIAFVGLSVLTLAFVPHEWITFADAELNWGRRDLLIFDTAVIDFSRQAFRDIIEAGLYTNTFAAMLALMLLWQRRFDLAEEKAAKQAAKAEKEAVPAGTSAYGRPMTKQA